MWENLVNVIDNLEALAEDRSYCSRITGRHVADVLLLTFVGFGLSRLPSKLICRMEDAWSETARLNCESVDEIWIIWSYIVESLPFASLAEAQNVSKLWCNN